MRCAHKVLLGRYIFQERQIAGAGAIQPRLEQRIAWQELLRCPSKQDDFASGSDHADQLLQGVTQLAGRVANAVRAPNPVEAVVIERELVHVSFAKDNSAGEPRLRHHL